MCVPLTEDEIYTAVESEIVELFETAAIIGNLYAPKYEHQQWILFEHQYYSQGAPLHWRGWWEQIRRDR